MPWVTASQLNKEQSGGGRWVKADEYQTIKKTREERKGVADQVNTLAQEAQKADNTRAKVGRWVFEGGLKQLGKDVWQGMKNTVAATTDVAMRGTVPGMAIEELRAMRSGVGAVKDRPEGVSRMQAYETGYQGQKGRETLYEKSSGRDLATPEGKRGFVASAAEAPTYAFGGMKAEIQAGKGLLSRIASRTIASQPEAIIEAGISTAGEEKPTMKSAALNYITASLLMSGISNVAGEIKLSKAEVIDAVKKVEKETGEQLSVREIADLEEGMKQGVKPEKVIENVKKLKGIDAPINKVDDIMEAGGRRTTQTPEIKSQTLDIETGNARRNIIDETPIKPPEPIKQAQPKPQELTYESTIGESKLARGVKQKALKNKLIYGFDKRFRDLPDYDKVTVKDQGAKATDMVLNDYDRAVRVAMGEELPPHGVLPESVFVALENHAIDSKNVDLLARLANRSTLVGEATGMGQRLRMLAERNPDSAVSQMTDVIKARSKAIEKKTGKTTAKAKSDVVKDIKKKIKQPIPTKEDWTAFVSKITC